MKCEFPTKVKFIAKSSASKRRPAFSLVAVLIIAIAGMALIGGVMYTFDAFSGSARTVVSSATEYNVLQDALEQGKSFLRYEMTKTGVDDAFTAQATTVEKLDDLLIRKKDGTVIGHVITSRDVRGPLYSGVLNLKIYDMQYDPGIVDGSITAEDKANLPPSAILPADGKSDCPNPDNPGESSLCPGGKSGTAIKAGAYLIRATLDFGDGRQKSIETAVVQAVG